jgi:hypothetical protein
MNPMIYFATMQSEDKTHKLRPARAEVAAGRPQNHGRGSVQQPSTLANISRVVRHYTTLGPPLLS